MTTKQTTELAQIIANSIKRCVKRIEVIREDHRNEIKRSNYSIEDVIEPHNTDLMDVRLIRAKKEMTELQTKINHNEYLLYMVGLDIDWNTYKAINREDRTLVG